MILAFDTSGADLHIGLFSDSAELLSEFHHQVSADERHIHDALLAESTRRLLSDTATRAADISRIGFINGPGSFTGLRIGLSFAKGIAFGSGAKLFPQLAHTVLLRQYELTVGPLMKPIPILYPGYERDSVYVSGSNEPESILYQRVNDVLDGDIQEVICTSALNMISITKHIVEIELRMVAKMALSGTPADLSTIEPFYGTDFKPGKTI